MSASAATIIWQPTSGTNDWFVGANWSGGNYPTNGDEVVMTNANTGVMLTNSTDYLASLLISNACTLVFSNWGTTLCAYNVEVFSSGSITHAGPWTNNEISNAVWIVATNVFVGTGAWIRANGNGYRANEYTGSGPGAGTYRGGGSHGGRGGSVGWDVGTFAGELGPTNGSIESPLSPGSAGGNAGGGHGGGVIWIRAADSITVDGTISANGANRSAGTYVGAGAGGSVNLSCKTFKGTKGTVSADGGSALGSLNGGGGGGGRVAVVYDPASQSNEPKPSVMFSANLGLGSAATAMHEGRLGTLYFPDTHFLTNVITALKGQIVVPAFTNWSVASIVISNVPIHIPVPGFRLEVTNDMLITGSSGRLELGGDTQNDSYDYYPYNQYGTLPLRVLVGNDLIVSNGSRLYLYSSMTNVDYPDYGALVDVKRDIYVYSNSCIYPWSHNTNGGSVHFRIRSLAVYGTINADYGGWRSEWGNEGYRATAAPKGGAGYYRGGGGHGGNGGWIEVGNQGLAYDSSNAPALPGSASGWSGGKGGGLIHVVALGDISIYGTLTANGGHYNYQYCGGGAGGGIYLNCLRLKGSGGMLQAQGGNGGSVNGPGGAGGRIAVWRSRDIYQGTLATNVAGGSGTGAGTNYFGDVGTVVFGWNSPIGSIVSLH